MAIAPRQDASRQDHPEADAHAGPGLSRRDALRSFALSLTRIVRAFGEGTLVWPMAASALPAVSSSPRNVADNSPMPATRQRTRNVTPHDERLPRHVRPTRYTLSFAPDLSVGTFVGEAVIALTVTQSTQDILLNAIDLQISHASIGRPAETPQTGTIRMLPDIERCRITVPRAITPGEWELHLQFNGRLNDNLHGFYRSTFTDEQGAPQILAVTQFEATDARRAFPCWDEPDFKAIFSLSLVVDAALTAISNTRILTERIEQGTKTVQFADTIPMSTYLLAFVVGRLEGTTPSFVGKTPVRVWSVPGKSGLAAYGQQLAAFSLRFLEDYYGIPYPGDKLDLIAIPDFSHGAMENLGAITFRERALLIEPDQATHGELEGLADVVCHEIAHMWFGDLVTMAWWNGLWLNEAFATFMEVIAVDAWNPQWQRWDSFALARAAALSTDGLQAARPIEFPVHAVKDLGAMFDVLTYQKGAAVLRMLEQFLGPTVFRDGVRDYLHTHAYANADTTDLWASLGKVAQRPIADIMNQWVFQPGYPLLMVSSQRSKQLTIRQRRFTYLVPTGRQQTVRDAVWKIPIQMSLHAAGEAISNTLLLDNVEVHLPVPDNLEFALLNPGGHGYYRVYYDPDLRRQLLTRLPDGLPPIDRFNLINDAWATCLAGVMPLGEYLDMTAHFEHDRSPRVWSVVLSSLDRMEHLISRRHRPALESFVRARLGPTMTGLGWSPRPGEDDLTRELRGDIIGTMGTLGNDAEVQARARTLYASVLHTPESVDPNLVPPLIEIMAFTGDEARYDEFFSRFKEARTPQEERRYLFSLGAFRDPSLVARTLASTLNGDIRVQDGAAVIGSLLSTSHGRDQAWAFVKANWKTFERRFPANGLRRLLAHLPGLATPALERDVHRFIDRHKIDLGGKALAQYVEQLRVAVAFRERESVALRAYVSSFKRSA